MKAKPKTWWNRMSRYLVISINRLCRSLGVRMRQESRHQLGQIGGELHPAPCVCKGLRRNLEGHSIVWPAGALFPESVLVNPRDSGTFAMRHKERMRLP